MKASSVYFAIFVVFFTVWVAMVGADFYLGGSNMEYVVTFGIGSMSFLYAIHVSVRVNELEKEVKILTKNQKPLIAFKEEAKPILKKELIKK